VTSAVRDPARPKGASAAHGWQWYATRAAIALFVVSLLGLLWVLHRQEIDEKRGAVIRDTLWVEQNVRFSLARDLEQLAQLGADVAAVDGGELELRAGYLLQNSPGLLRIVLLDERGRVRTSVPAPADPGGVWS
jgi:two-component system sensor histidine kinase DctS